MMKPKHALVKDGFLPAGSENTRGRLSGAAIERCKELAAQGWEIEGYVTSKSKSPDAAPTVEKVKVQAGVKEVADIGPMLRDESYWTAYANVNGKTQTVGMRTVCNNCHNSLTYCPCKSPVVNFGHLSGVDTDCTAVVNFKPRN